MTINLTRRTALIGLSSFVASRVRAQTNPPSNSVPDAAESVSLEAPAVFDIAPTTGTLKETVQKGQRLIWRGKSRMIVDFKSPIFPSHSSAMRLEAK
jgi:hypothetical protein